METPVPIRCPRSLRASWPDPLAREWLERFWFAEVKAPPRWPNQAASHEAITRDVGVPVEVLRFAPTEE